MTPPLVSVVLPVYNPGRYLRECMDSLVAQTYPRLEVVVVDDGSTDESDEVIRSYADVFDCMVHVRRENRGLVATLNEAIGRARGDLIARMDADDIAHPRRLAVQVRFLESHPRVDICGTWVERIGEGGQHLGRWRGPRTVEGARMGALFRSPVFHPSVVFRRTLWEAYGPDLYRPGLDGLEDYELWTRLLAAGHGVANVPFEGLRYRVHGRSVTGAQRRDIRRRSWQVRRAFLEGLGIESDARATRALCCLATRLCPEFGEQDCCLRLGSYAYWVGLWLGGRVRRRLGWRAQWHFTRWWARFMAGYVALGWRGGAAP